MAKEEEASGRSDPEGFEGDEIGPWSEVKLAIVRKYASAYSRILAAQGRFEHVYIDGFAGTGQHRVRATGEIVPGSPAIALQTEPPFSEYHFIDLQPKKVLRLEELKAGRPNVYVYEGDCNEVLLREVFPRVLWKDFRRGLCLLDPYGKQLSWNVVAKAGEMKTIDLLLHFPIGAINRTVLRRDNRKITPEADALMTDLWGDENWREVAYRARRQLSLGFDGDSAEMEKGSYGELASAFRDRLRSVAGFANVPEPILMRNRLKVPLYYIFFASAKDTAEKVIVDIFRQYRRG